MGVQIMSNHEENEAENRDAQTQETRREHATKQEREETWESSART